MLVSGLRFAVYWFLRLYNRLEAIGADNVPDEGPVIIAANHVSYIDPPVLAVSTGRRVTFIAKHEVFNCPVMRPIANAWAIPVRRESPRPSDFRDSIRKLKAGGVLVIFPEGGIPDEPDVEAKRGVGALARISGAVVVPAYLRATDRALPLDSWFIRPRKISVVFGRPLEPGDDDEAFASRVLAEIRNLGDEEGKG